MAVLSIINTYICFLQLIRCYTKSKEEDKIKSRIYIRIWNYGFGLKRNL